MSRATAHCRVPSKLLSELGFELLVFFGVTDAWHTKKVCRFGRQPLNLLILMVSHGNGWLFTYIAIHLESIKSDMMRIKTHYKVKLDHRLCNWLTSDDISSVNRPTLRSLVDSSSKQIANSLEISWTVPHFTQKNRLGIWCNLSLRAIQVSDDSMRSYVPGRHTIN